MQKARHLSKISFGDVSSLNANDIEGDAFTWKGEKAKLLAAKLTRKIEKFVKANTTLSDNDKYLLLEIFKDVADDPSWYEESILYEIYCQRIDVKEIMSLFTCDSHNTHWASKKQSKVILDLFDKVNGYPKHRSRFEEQQKRYAASSKAANKDGKDKKDESPEKKEKEKEKNTKVLNEMYNVSGFST